MKRLIYLAVFSLLAHSLTGCYSFTGASIPPTVKTFSVQFFENRAPLVDPTLSQKFTESLKDRITRQSPLGLTKTIGDVNFEGTITGYRIEPVSFTSTGETGSAEQNRLTITVQVKYTNTKDEKLSFDQSFSQFENFSKSQNLSGTFQIEVNQLIIDKLTTDIYNRAFSNW
ncbi:LPS assembly lipoprotein LptE [Solitalea sp. MAHUQ-68]|uniref:LPS assembly lipoprotein LptE n=1 Tax=Solitalea agri TaxID=2953739 RepID=A0A9X2F2A3_9SPHI|nr:LptE family protein [Solitalea agri]MCO4292911.1 LPS assembly lipoprotein LptE [Solitalea agri]